MDLVPFLVVLAHDQRDLDFALKYKLKIKTVVKPLNENQDLQSKRHRIYWSR